MTSLLAFQVPPPVLCHSRNTLLLCLEFRDTFKFVATTQGVSQLRFIESNESAPDL
ncbi:hypothetical protein PHLCEN_2v10467 [Hermanssonia centrifuga]|uniref:Uncharacterized protein n=1 Tax=Hermanssonia centrifuga TaxID=98765 RepID=A0A2R6NME4_9APHY|nr:hypothetical protein PHLCEN_2v10467 [Hermanssonia centrifuga]